MFSKKVVFITGASSGLGAATAIRFAKEGAELALTGRNVQNLEATAKKCLAVSHKTPLTIPGDLTKEEDMKTMINKTIQTFGKLDILINVAGAMELGNIEQATLAQFDKLMGTNVRGMYYMTHLAAPHLIKTKGNVVNTSSIGGLRAFPEMTAYCMSKAAVNQFTMCAALDLADKEVRVNAVCPGFIGNETPAHGLSDEQWKSFQKKMAATYPIGRLSTRDEIIDGIMFLASDKASFVTGHILAVEGGKAISSPR